MVSLPEDSQPRELSPLAMYAWAVMIGIIGALGAVVFRGMIAGIHNLMFLGQWSFRYDANLHTAAGPWGAWVILVPVIGAAGVAFLVSNFAPEAKGHGVPEVMDAIYYHKAAIRPVVAVVKSLASALSIGSGGSVGREGPIVQIGSSFGSTLGQLLHVPLWQRITMIAAGGGAGIAATFNTPIGGVLFAVEIMLHEVSARTLVPVTFATVTASYGGRLAFGAHPSFIIPAFETPDFHYTTPAALVLFIVLGVVMGLVSVAYIRSIYGFEDFFDRYVPGNYYTRHMFGMLLVGIIMYVLLKTAGHYYVQGVGYATVQDVLSGDATWFLLVLCALKLLVTSLTLGSGASGGIFSPGLYMGATLGGVFGLAAQTLFPGLPVHPAAFAVAGMAGVIGGSTGAAMAAIVMIFEMTLDYGVIIPITLTVAMSYGVRTMLQPESIYTQKLARRGHFIPTALQTNAFTLRLAGDVMQTSFATVHADDTRDALARTAVERPDAGCFLVEGAQGVVVGVVARDATLTPHVESEHPVTLGEIADRRFVTVSPSAPLLEVMTRMRTESATIAVVAEGPAPPSCKDVRGLITSKQIAGAVISGMELFSG